MKIKKIMTTTMTMKMKKSNHNHFHSKHSAVELAQFYLKSYTWWKTMRQEEGKTHGYTWEFFKECIELEFIQKNLTTSQDVNFVTL